MQDLTGKQLADSWPNLFVFMLVLAYWDSKGAPDYMLPKLLGDMGTARVHHNCGTATVLSLLNKEVSQFTTQELNQIGLAADTPCNPKLSNALVDFITNWVND